MFEKSTYNTCIAIGIVLMALMFLIEHMSARSTKEELAATKIQLAKLQKDNEALKNKPKEIAYKTVTVIPRTRATKVKQGGEPQLWEVNNNWLNIKKPINANRWEGQVGVDKFNHAVFEDPLYSIRAAAIVIHKYVTVYKIDTVTDLVQKFCTGNWNNYIKHLCTELKVKPTQKVDFIKRMPDLLQAMAHFETGQRWHPKYFAMFDLVTRVRSSK